MRDFVRGGCHLCANSSRGSSLCSTVPASVDGVAEAHKAGREKEHVRRNRADECGKLQLIPLSLALLFAFHFLITFCLLFLAFNRASRDTICVCESRFAAISVPRIAYRGAISATIASAGSLRRSTGTGEHPTNAPRRASGTRNARVRRHVSDYNRCQQPKTCDRLFNK